MSEDKLIVLNNREQALAKGGLGFGDSRLFQLKPATIELVQKTTRQEGAQPGRFRITSTNEHFDSMRIVLLGQPQEQREYYEKGKDFSRDARLCFSLDALQPHPRAKEPGAINCAVCPFGDINWKKWYQTKDPKDLPPCRKYWHCILADRATQMLYYLNVKGTSVSPFEQSMQNLARLYAAMVSNVNAANKKLKAEYDAKVAAATTGKTVEDPIYQSMPNIFDITFTLYPYQKEKGGPWIIGCKDFAAMKPEDRASFGNLFLEFHERRQQGQVQDQLVSEAQEAAAAVTTTVAAPATSAQEVAAIAQDVEGEVLPPEASKITI